MKDCNYITLNEFEHYGSWYTYGRNSAAVSALSVAQNILGVSSPTQDKVSLQLSPNNVPQWTIFPLATYLHNMRRTHITLSCLELKLYFCLLQHHSQTVPEIRDQRVPVCDI